MDGALHELWLEAPELGKLVRLAWVRHDATCVGAASSDAISIACADRERPVTIGARAEGDWLFIGDDVRGTLLPCGTRAIFATYDDRVLPALPVAPLPAAISRASR